MKCKKRVPICGDYYEKSTVLLLNQCAKLDNKCELTLRLHPAQTASSIQQACLKLNVKIDCSDSINTICNADVVVCGASSLTAIDALLLGKPVVLFVKKGELNMNPSAGFPGVRVARTKSELINCVDRKKHSAGYQVFSGEWFFSERSKSGETFFPSYN